MGRANVVLEGFRPGVMKRLGADYETLRKINPRIIYCATSTFINNHLIKASLVTTCMNLVLPKVFCLLHWKRLMKFKLAGLLKSTSSLENYQVSLMTVLNSTLV